MEYRVQIYSLSNPFKTTSHCTELTLFYILGSLQQEPSLNNQIYIKLISVFGYLNEV